MNTKQREKMRFNEVRQLAYVLGTEERRFYSNNRVTRMQWKIPRGLLHAPNLLIKHRQVITTNYNKIYVENSKRKNHEREQISL